MIKSVLTILTTALVLSSLLACTNIVLPKKGKLVKSVTYNAGMIVQKGISEYDFQLVNDSNAIVVPPSTGETSHVSSVRPIRRGYVFQYWTDGANHYQPGDLFTDDTVLQADGSVLLCAVFETEDSIDETKKIPALDSKYWRKSKQTMFSVSPEELMSVDLREHSNGRKLGDDITEDSQGIDVMFVNFPGGYIWDVPNYKTSSNSNTPISNPSAWHKAVVGLNEGPDGASIFVEDFALAETELTGGVFYVAKKWNDDYNKGYNLNAVADGSSSVNHGQRFFSGLLYPSGFYDDIYMDRESAYDPLVFVSFKEAVVICNMLTQWYNEVKRPEGARKLTFAYTKDGRSVGSNAKHRNVIKDVNDPEILLIGAKRIKNSTLSMPFSHVQGATGFRLPSPAEWMFAATVNPKNDTQNYGAYCNSTYRFPSIINPSYSVGGNKVASSADSTYAYAVTNNEYGYIQGSKNIDHGTASVKTKLENAVGLYDMTGNVWELTDGFTFKSSNSEVPDIQCFSPGLDVQGIGQTPSYCKTTSASLSDCITGIRLCRTTASYPVVM